VKIRASVSNHPDAVVSRAAREDMVAASKPASKPASTANRAVKRDRKAWKTTTNSPLVAVRDKPVVDRVAAVRTARS
jgi:hypothetical protein